MQKQADELLDAKDTEIALLKKRAVRAIHHINNAQPNSAIGALEGDYDADL